jgi:nifR3 family TIM-barrel protein
MVRLGSLAIDPPLFLAPMAGITDRDFRLILRRIGGVGLVTMEFVSGKGLLAGDRLARRIMVFCPEERPLAIQIYGSDPHTMAEAARRVEAAGADVCDVNMGCPANKVLKGCAGAALMSDLALAEAIVRAVRRAIAIPLTVKFRLGLDDRRRNYLDLARLCEANGVDAVALHGRTARQMFSGAADWEPIARLKAAVSIPVVGNGDVETADDALAMLAATGCDGVMIGRAATRDPWIFRDIASRLDGRRVPAPSLAERCALVLDHFRAVAAREPERIALHKLRVFTRWYSHGLPGGARLRRSIGELPDVATFLAEVERFCGDRLLEEAA